jgi:hypothetical protein
MANVARLLIAIGAVAASVGFTLLGMAMSYITPDQTAIRNWIVLMIAGLVVLIAGVVIYRGVEPSRLPEQ